MFSGRKLMFSGICAPIGIKSGGRKLRSLAGVDDLKQKADDLLYQLSDSLI
jgi:hypothetical protein